MRTADDSRRAHRHIHRLLSGARRRRLVERLLRGTVRQARSLAKGDAGVDIAIGTGVALATASIVANSAGAAVVVLVAGLLIPAPNSVSQPSVVLAINLSVLVVYFPLAVFAGAGAAVKLLRPVLTWLLPGKTPTARQQFRALRYPLLQARVHAILWLLAVPVFTTINAFFNVQLAASVGLTVLLGGLSTVAVGYLLVERVWRRVSVAALREYSPDRPALPGVAVRLVTTWLLATAVPLLGLLLVLIEPVRLDRSRLVVVVAVLTCLSLVTGLLAQYVSAHAVADPLQEVREAIERVGQGELDIEMTVFDGGEIGLLQSGVNRMVAGLREREQLHDLFRRQVGFEVAADALAQAPSLGGKLREVAVLFVDVVGSTGLAEDEGPAEIVAQLNRFFSTVVRVVSAHGGHVNKFEGDAALCIFGAPEPLPDSATACLCAARTLSAELRDTALGLQAAVGVSAGTVVAGYVGSEDRYEYTVIGDPVNEASRITDLAKGRTPPLLTSTSALDAARPAERSCWENSEVRTLRGRSNETQLASPRKGAVTASCSHRSLSGTAAEHDVSVP